MKRIFTYILSSCLVPMLFYSCDKEDIMRYDRDRAAIEFNGSSYAYSFKKTSKTVDTVSIPFKLVGYPEARKREANFYVIADSTTASEKNYRPIDAILEADAYQGTLRIQVMNPVGEAFEDVRLYLQIAPGEDFIPGLDEKKDYILYLTNKLVRPTGWDLNSWKERYFLGTYSTAYYQFIIEVTGETEFPYPNAIPGYNNGEKWNSADKDAFLGKLREELKARNKREGSPLLHDDGPAKGKEVVIGKYYQN